VSPHASPAPRCTKPAAAAYGFAGSTAPRKSVNQQERHGEGEGRRTVARDEDGDDEAVDSDDAGHDDRDERLCVGGSECGRADRATGRTFMMSSGLNPPRPAIPMPALDVPYAAPTATRSLSTLHLPCTTDACAHC
jgi:hypothetical protein